MRGALAAHHECSHRSNLYDPCCARTERVSPASASSPPMRSIRAACASSDQAVSVAQVTLDVVVIVHHRRDPRHETVEVCVEVEAIPEDILRCFDLQRSEAVPYFGRDEVNAILTI